MRPDGAAAIENARPDVIVTACFPWRLPAAVLALPPLGCLNIHPSLLPRGRGPDPVFWTFRRGERVTGVTVHLMDAGLDTGPILTQERMNVPVGARASEVERELMALGGRMTATLLPAWARGEINPRPQDDSLATAAPVPGEEDFEITTAWHPEAAFAFAAGVAPLRGPLAVRVLETGERIPVGDALDHEAEAATPAPVVDEGRGVFRVRFGQGWVRFLRADAGRYALSLSPINARDIR
jgi:methionyl-tRNA formyltransferase